MKTLKNKSLWCYFLLTAVVFLLGFTYVPTKLTKVSANSTQTKTENEIYIENWLNHENAWADDTINLAQYKEYLSKYNSNEEAIVVVVDTGICTLHPMFEGRIATAKTTKTYELGYTNDSSQYVELYNVEAVEGDLLGCALTNRESTIDYTDAIGTNPNIPADYKWYPFEDDDGHGTSVSGTLASLSPSNVKILPFKRENMNDGYIKPYDMLAIFTFVEQLVNDGYNIVAINMSFTIVTNNLNNADQDFNKDGTQLMPEVIEENIKKLRDEYNVLTCVSAGNTNTNTNLTCLAGCEYAVTCGGIKQDGNGGYTRMMAGTNASSYGTSVDFAAPAQLLHLIDIAPSGSVDPQTIKFDVTKCKSGTSHAAPTVAAMLASFAVDKNYYNENGEPTYTADLLEQRLIDSVIDLTEDVDNTSNADLTGRDIYYGHGMVTYTNHMIKINHEATNNEVTYDGESHTINIKANVETDVYYSLTEDGEYNITDISNVDEFKNFTNGQLPIYYKLTGRGDQSNTYFAETKGVAYLTINKRNVAATLSNQEFTYGEINFDNAAYNITIGEVVAGDESAFVLTTTATNTSDINSYPIALNCLSNNYNLTTTNEATLTIVPREITVQVGNATSVYGTQPNLTNVTYQVILGKIVNGDSLNESYTCVATSTSGVGEYQIEMVSNNANYSVTTLKGKLSVTPKTIVINLNKQTSVYGETINLKQNEYSFDENQLVGSDVLTVELSTNATNESNAGTYLILAESTNANYVVDYVDGEYEITKMIIDATVDNQQCEYAGVILNNTMFIITEGSIVAGDEDVFVLNTTATNTSGVNTYPITLTCLSNNYQVRNVVNGTLTIVPREITVQVGNATSVYGTQPNLTNVTYQVILGKIVNGDSLNESYTCVATSTSGVGEYQIEMVSNNANYNVTTLKGKLSVTPKTVTITLQNQALTYGDNIVLNNGRYEISEGELVGEDTLNVVLATQATNTSNVGSYAITVGSNNPNYIINFEDGVLTINKRSITIKLDNCVIKRGEELNLQALTYQTVLGNIVNNDDLQLNYSSNAILNKLGKYELTATYLNNNYEVTIQNGEIEVVRNGVDKLLLVLAIVIPVLAVISIVLPMFVLKGKRRKL